MQYVFLLLILLLSAPLSWAADPPPSDGIESLESELLEGLAPNALEAPATPPLNRDDALQADPRNPNALTPRFDDLGEDIGQPSGSLSLARVRLGMEQAQAMLAAKNAADVPAIQQVGKVQTEVVAQLDKLIAELSKQCNCNGQCQSPSNSQKPNTGTPKKSGKSGAAAGRGKAAARDSSDRLGNASAKPVEKGDVEAMVKDLWGHLPERSRQQMMQSFSGEFLPKYELEIEQYYRRLSEEKYENR